QQKARWKLWSTECETWDTMFRCCCAPSSRRTLALAAGMRRPGTYSFTTPHRRTAVDSNLDQARASLNRRSPMAVAKTLEIISSSTESIEAAVRDGIAK